MNNSVHYLNAAWGKRTIFALAMGLLPASAAMGGVPGANTGETFRLGADSTFQEGCFDPCMCPIMMEQQVLGTFKRLYTGQNGSLHEYSIEDVNWFLPNGNSADRIIGSGKYVVGSPDPTTLMQHRLELNLRVGDDPVQHFDSGWGPWNPGGIHITISINGMYCWDRVIRIHADPVPASDYHRYSLDHGSTFQRGCIDGLCDCAVGPEYPMQGEFALVQLQSNPLFQDFAVVDVRWRAMTANTATGIPIAGFGLYRVGGEVAVQNRLRMRLKVADEEPQHYDSGMVSGGGQFPHIDIVTRTHTNCVDTVLHVIASPDNGGGEVCGGIMGTQCSDPHEFCKLPPGHCCCDFQGVCTPIAQTCPEYYDPVCGCDGVTYSNECFAEMAGQSIDHWGPCGNSCGGPNSLCAPGEFCKFPAGSCGINGEAGHCTQTPGGCPDVWDPVCGCNGITYGNECEADAAGVSVRHEGICEDPCRPTPDAQGCTSCFSDIPEDVCRASILHLNIHGGAITTLDCDCMNMNACHIEFGNASPHAEGNCPEGQTCEVVSHDTDNDGFDDTFWAQCMSTQVGACCLDIDDGPILYDTCMPRTEAQCKAEGGIFGGSNAGCDAARACCLGNAGMCADLHPACCEANNGIAQGPGSNCESSPCGDVCGGIAGIPCDDPGDFCKLPTGQCCCDHLGVCTPTGGSCPTVWDPVCGCDGQTYGNDCEADAAGVSILHAGECSSPTCAATRVLDHTGTHCDGLTLHIELHPPSNTTAMALEDSPPAGWTATNISHGGVYDAANHKVKWGPLFPPFPAAVSYFAAPNQDTNTPPCFSGTVSVNGFNGAICGDSCLGPCCPRMSADLPHDPCGTCPVTDCNSCDASICGDASIHMCEIVGYACAWLHGCNDDMAGMTRAAYIWRHGECYCWDEAAGNWYPTDCANNPASGCCAEAGRIFDGTDASAVLSESTAHGRNTRRTTRQFWVDLDVPSSATAVALEVNVPAGWKVTGMTDGGVFDPASRKIKWGVFFDDLSRTVGFTAHGPAKDIGPTRTSSVDGSNRARWRGQVSVDGINQPIRVR